MRLSSSSIDAAFHKAASMRAPALAEDDTS